jgi:Flp pilus assembly protein TadD
LSFKLGSLCAVIVVAFVSCGIPQNKIAGDYGRAKLLYSQGRIDEALRALESLVARAGGFAPGRLLYGRTLYFHHDYEKAKEVFSALQKDRPESLEASIWLVRTLAQLHKSSEAEALLVQLLEVNPDDPRLAYQMALLRELHNDLPGSSSFLDSAATFDEDLALVHFEAARVRQQLHDVEGSRRELRKTLGVLPEGSLLQGPVEKLLSDFGPTSNADSGTPSPKGIR